MKLLQKVAIVTGSSRGIGAAIARDLAAHGARLIVNYHGNRPAADKVVANIKEAGGEAVAVQADVSTPGAAATLFDAAIEHYARADILVNNAGIVLYKPIADVTDDEFDRLWAINVRGVFALLREAATRLADGGRIINLSSTTTRLLMPTYGPYVATKAAVEGLSRILAKEVGSRGITVNSVSPGPTNTELFVAGKNPETLLKMAAMSAFGRLGEPEDIAQVVSFLTSPAAGWISGQNIGANGGLA